MTAEGQAHGGVTEVSANSKSSIGIQGDQRALDVSSVQDPSKFPALDCNGNGISHHEDNGIGREDAEDNSYVFISGNNDLIPIDNDLNGNTQVSDNSQGVEVQNGKFQKSPASEEDSSWVFEGTQVTSSNNCSVEKNDADALQVAVTGEAAQGNGKVATVHSGAGQPENPQVEPKCSLAPEGNQESKVGVLESGVDSAGNGQPRIASDINESFDINHEPQENNFQSTFEVGESQELKDASLEATPCRTSEVGILEPSIVGSNDDNQESQENNFESIRKLGEKQVGEFEGTDSVANPEPGDALNVVESVDVNKNSQEENLELESESGEEQGSQKVGLEVTCSRSLEVEVSKGNEAPQNSDSSNEGNQDSQNVQYDSARHAPPEIEVQKFEKQSDVGPTSAGTDSVVKPKPETATSVVGESAEVDEAHQNSESNHESVGTHDSQNMHSDCARHSSPQKEIQNVEEQSDTEQTNMGADSVGNPDSEILLDVGKSSAMEVSNTNEAQQSKESSDELGETLNSQNTDLDSARHTSPQNMVQKVAEQSDMEPTNKSAASVVDHEPEIALDVDESIDVHKISQEEKLELKSKSGEFQESQNSPLEVSSEAEVRKENEAQQNSESPDESGGTQDSQCMQSDSATSASRLNEVQQVDEQSDTESTNIISLTSPQCDYSLEEQVNTEIHSSAKEILETVADLAENGECILDPGVKIDNSTDEVVLHAESVQNENKDLVSSVNESVTETKMSIGYKNDKEKPLQLQESSESTFNLMLTADSGIDERPVDSDENVLDIAREHGAEDQDSRSTSNVATNTHELVKPEARDADDMAAENALDRTREYGTEDLSSCSAENDVGSGKEVIQQDTEVEAVSSPESDSKFNTISVKDVPGGDSIGCSTKVITSMEFELQTPDPEDVATLQGDDIHLKNKVSIEDDKFPDLPSAPSEADKEFEIRCSSVISSRDMPCKVVFSKNDIFDSSVARDKFPNSDKDNVDIGSKGDDLSGAHNPMLGNSSTGAVASQEVVIEPLTRPFHFLIRMPRFEDLKMKEQIRKAQLLVEEKTHFRDAFRIEVQKYKGNCLGYAAEYEAAVSESRALKRSVKAKRAEIDSLQSVINKVKNAISVEDIDTRIHSMEHMIEHETLPLKEEKLLIREIKQLKQLREQLSSNIGSQDEVQQALNNRDQIEERLKVLKKELDSLKDSVLKADAVARALEKKYEDENKKVKEVQTQYVAANNVRQDAYAHLQSLRKQLFEKNQQFRTYKDNAAAASDYAVKRDREALHHLCVNQVESIMELWNKNDEFRKDYIRCNMKSTLRRLGTLDGRSLGPDEQPPVFTSSYGDEKVDRLVSNPVNTQNLEQEVARPIQGVTIGDKTKRKESEQKSPTARPRKQEKPVPCNGLATVSGREINDEIREEQHMPKQEELDLTRKDEELRKEEAAAKLKEQRRLEEKAKALEALERKKRNAEKAQMRAELRAQKEAEQREKEREKRMRKKERKKATAIEPDGNSLVETSQNCESLVETMEPEIKENPTAAPKRTQKPSQFTKQSKAKSIPPPLRNRGRRKMQQWMWVILTCLFVIALFLLGNVGFFSNLSNLRRRNSLL